MIVTMTQPFLIALVFIIAVIYLPIMSFIVWDYRRKKRHKLLICVALSLVITLLILIMSFFDVGHEYWTGVFILGLPLTAFVENIGKISSTYGKNVWIMLCLTLFSINTLIILYPLLTFCLIIKGKFTSSN